MTGWNNDVTGQVPWIRRCWKRIDVRIQIYRMVIQICSAVEVFCQKAESLYGIFKGKSCWVLGHGYLSQLQVQIKRIQKRLQKRPGFWIWHSHDMLYKCSKCRRYHDKAKPYVCLVTVWPDRNQIHHEYCARREHFCVPPSCSEGKCRWRGGGNLEVIGVEFGQNLVHVLRLGLQNWDCYWHIFSSFKRFPTWAVVSLHSFIADPFTARDSWWAGVPCCTHRSQCPKSVLLLWARWRAKLVATFQLGKHSLMRQSIAPEDESSSH